MVIRVQRFRTWAELVQEALRLAELGFICEVRGFDDMIANKLTISTDDLEQADGEKSFKMRDATPEEQEVIDIYIKSISKPTGVMFGQADGEYISKTQAIDDITTGLCEDIACEKCPFDKPDIICKVRKWLKQLPAVAMPNKTGHWIDDGFYAEGHSHRAFHCSECGHTIIGFKDDLGNYCPNCGAKMGGEEK